MAEARSHHGGPAPRPAHVPEALVYDFDMFADAGIRRDPHGRTAELRRDAPPVFWTPHNGGHWMLIGYEANSEAARATELFSSAIMPPEMAEAMAAHVPPGTPRLPKLVPIFLDPPDHGKYRTPLNAAFSPRTMHALQGDIRTLARELIAGVAAKGRCDFMRAVAVPVPVHTFLKLMGLPIERSAEFRSLASEIIAGAGDPPEVLMRRTFRMLASMRETIDAREHDRRDDFISMLWNLEIEGRPSTRDEVEDMALLLFIAGLDTVMNAIGHGVCHLARDPALQARLRAEPALIAEAKEELLRLYSFVSPPRRIARDCTFQGVEMRRNERAVLFLAGAGIDPERYPDPRSFSLERGNLAHLAFNAGPHRCLGASLARIELQIVYEELLTGLPEFRTDPERPPEYASGQNLGIAKLELVWSI